MKNVREKLIFFLVGSFFILILARLFYLQVLKGDYYLALILGTIQPPVQDQKPRGEVFFRDGEILATNKKFYLLAIDPKNIKDKKNLARKLKEVLGIEEKEVLENLRKGNLFLIPKELEKEDLEKLKIKEKGIFIREGFKRFYPQKEMAANVIGFLGGEGKGEYGIEKYYDLELAQGKDLVLTLDYEIQFGAEKILKEGKEKFNFEKGEILVMDPQNGEILALAVWPSFDPNHYQEFVQTPEIFKNPVSQEVFEPGSVFKAVTMAIALEEKKITPQTTYEDPGEVKINGWTIRNYAHRRYPGKITMTTVLEKSINTGAIFARELVEDFVFLDYLERLGIFQKTGVDLPEEILLNQEIKKKSKVALATASFGQGIALTPLQLARIYATFANGGKLIVPHLNKNFSGGERQIFSKETTNQLTQMLISVIENGFGKRGKVKGYSIAAKTGTSFQPKIGERGYSNKTWQSVAGYFPAFYPQFLILVKLDNPKTSTAEFSALPIFKETVEYLIKVAQIPPDHGTD